MYAVFVHSTALQEGMTTQAFAMSSIAAATKDASSTPTVGLWVHRLCKPQPCQPGTPPPPPPPNSHVWYLVSGHLCMALESRLVHSLCCIVPYGYSVSPAWSAKLQQQLINRLRSPSYGVDMYSLHLTHSAFMRLQQAPNTCTCIRVACLAV